jgi:hypothetical protein
MIFKPCESVREYTPCLEISTLTGNKNNIVFPKPYSYPIKIIQRFGTNFVTRLWGLLASPMSISEEQKTNARKFSLVSCELKYSG